MEIKTHQFTFTQAASGSAKPKRGFMIFWMMIIAIAILDDGDAARKTACASARQGAKNLPAAY